MTSTVVKCEMYLHQSVNVASSSVCLPLSSAPAGGHNSKRSPVNKFAPNDTAGNWIS